MYSIKEMSQMFNLPSSTIRYYESIGLLENVQHKNGYHRIYDESHVHRLHAIECFKKALLPLEEIKQFFEYEKDIVANSTDIVNMMKNQEEKTLSAIKDLEDGLAHVKLKVRYYSLVNEAVKNGKELPKWEDVI